MNRRRFLQSVSALAFCSPAPQSPPKSAIREFGGGYNIEVGCLRCSLDPQRSGSTLVFGVFLTSNPEPGVIEETRMIPTEFLKAELQAVGFPVVWEIWHPDYPFLVAHLDHVPSPHDVAARLQRVLSGNDSRLFSNGPGWVEIDAGEFEVR